MVETVAELGPDPVLRSDWLAAAPADGSKSAVELTADLGPAPSVWFDLLADPPVDALLQRWLKWCGGCFLLRLRLSSAYLAAFSFHFSAFALCGLFLLLSSACWAAFSFRHTDFHTAKNNTK